MDRRVTPPKRVTSPTWVPPPPCKQALSYWKYDKLHAIVEFGSAFFEEISKRNANLSELPHTLNIYGGNINVTFVLRSKGTLVCNPSSIVY